MTSSSPAWEHVDSSNVERVAYDDNSHTLCVKFRSGGLYTYSGVDRENYLHFIGAESVGRYLNNVIKATHPYQRHNTEAELEAFLKK